MSGPGEQGRARSSARRRAAEGNLPVALSSFVGRRDEVARITELLATSRLVTLTGVGGAGKTRLALQVASELRQAFDDGAWFVDLAQTAAPGLLAAAPRDPDAIACEVLATLGVQQQGRAPVSRLAAFLAGRRTLLMLDNCEHVVPASAMLVGELLAACPTLRVLATSRESLAAEGEVLFPVPPLPTPDPHRRLWPADLEQYESVALLVARARAVVPGFALTEQNQDTVAELCRRLDGLPLAIELTAARMRALAPQQILDRLSERFALLSRGSRQAPARQQTLRACVEWSFDLCSKPERLLWARLSVFVGGFDLDALEAVCTDEALPSGDLIDVVSGLVDKSVIDRAEGGNGDTGAARYRTLETVRDFGHEQLARSGTEAEFRRRHRDWFRSLTQQVRAEWVSERQTYWFARMLREHGNLRTAMGYCLGEPGEAREALEILVSVPRLYWWSRGMSRDGLEWFERALAQARAATPLRAEALLNAAFVAAVQRDAATNARLLAEGDDLARRLDQARLVALAAYVRVQAAIAGLSDVASALETVEEGLAALSTAAEPDPALRLHLLLQQGTTAVITGDLDLARRSYQQVVELTGERGETFNRTSALWGLGMVAWRNGDAPAAGRYVMASLRAQPTLGAWDPQITGLTLELLAWVAADQEHHRRAATLLGAADTMIRDIGQAVPPGLAADHDACERRTRDALGDAAFTDAFRRGGSLSFDEMLAMALDRPTAPKVPRSGPPRRSRASDMATPLTSREQQIAELIADGLSNKAIAAALVISQRTAEGHVEHILAKLGFRSRAQIATWVITRRSAD